MEAFSRIEMLLGEAAIEKLASKKVAVFGLGGVGSYTAAALARAGVGKLILVDFDEIKPSNINRQLCALHSTVGKPKVEVVKERILDINPDAKVEIFKEFVTKESRDYFDSNVSYVVDAIDTVTAKLDLIERASRLNVPIISCMGTGNKLDPTRFEITDINKTSVCPLAKVMRKELKQRGIKKLKVLYSKEEPIKQEVNEGERRTPGSISFVPSVAGLIIAGEVIKDLIK